MIQVVCAILKQKDQVLICQRSTAMKLPLKWEFPGGKVEHNETKEESLIREIKEELGLDIAVQEPLTPVRHQYPDFAIELIPFVCTIVGGDVKPTEHQRAEWVEIKNLMNYDWAAADIPIVRELMELWN